MLRRLVQAAALLAAGYLAIVAFQLWSVRSDLLDAERALGDLTLESIRDSGGLRGTADPILDRIRDAEATADSPLLGALTGVPGAGTQIEALRSITDRVAALGEVGDDALADVETALDSSSGPDAKVELVRTAIDTVDRLEAGIAGTTLPRRRGVLPPLRDAADDLDRRLDEATTQLRDLRAQLAVARDLLAGPTRVLVVAANNAEVRAGMGMHLSAGIVTIEDGNFASTPFVPAAGLLSVTDGRAGAPAELAELYQRIWDFGREWRTTSTTPNFPVVGEILADLSGRTPFGPVDAVLSIDVPALAHILRSTGPVEVDGITYDDDNIVDELLRDNYLRLGEPTEARERRELQGEVAAAVFDAVTRRDIDLLELASEMAAAAEGRNLLGWSGDQGIQDLWESFGADGSLSPRSFLVAFQNATASKRDYYIDPTVHVSPLATESDGSRRFRIVAELANPVLEATAPYVDSLNRFVPVGVHRAFVTFTLPGTASDIDVRDGDIAGIGTDGPTTVVAVWIRVPEGESRFASVEVTFPAAVRAVELVPSARVRPTAYRFGPVNVHDATPLVVPLPLVDAYRVREPKLVEASALVLVFLGLALFVARSRRLTAPEPDIDAARADGQLAAAMLLLAAALLAVAALG